ncbi:ornithine carbamoyltransferase [Streptomyces zagrosensis]|uniref:Ornithine carbamoyltransferase n=1 Tax=Streptomyces zagrosensis TaxID=1042984 RepID=A0A7W9V2L2_9ACTN|nr:ornithine carbamoyltransferase [Streptomyces zagrosensis]MBB5940410.1 ornithine carbamoyltransferase [Streptomyces zagrosensis]
MRHIISINDLTDADLRHIVERGAAYAAGDRVRPLEGAIVGVYFRRTSTRTRTAFTSGALRLGAQTVTFGPGDLQLNTGESIEDTARVLAGMLDLLVARTADATAELRTLAAGGPMSVINAMSAEEHPTQGLTDLTTLYSHFGRVEGLRLMYVGEGNNSAAALALALTRFPGTELELRTPIGYGLAPEILATAITQAGRCGSKVSERHDMEAVPAGLDAIYTTRWQTTGTSKATADWRDVFAPFQVTRELWQSSPNAVFLHDLPAHRGEEVTAEVLDGPASIAFTQATHKLHSAMAVLEWCWANRR